MSIKSILLSFLTVLATGLSSSALADAEPFRVNGEHQCAGYAVAWGVPGKSFDFTAIEEQGDEAVDKFVDQYVDDVVNYVVHLDTNTVLYTITEPGGLKRFSLGYRDVGNFYDVTLFWPRVAAEQTDVVLVLEHFKWNNQISKALVVDRTSEVPRVAAVQTDLQEQFESQVFAAIPRSAAKRLADMARNITLEFANESGDLVKFTLEGYTPKAAIEDSMTVEGLLKVEVKDGKVRLNVLRARVTES